MNKNRKSFELICEILQKDPSPVIRHEAAFLLGASKKRRALAPIIRSIKSDKSNLVVHEALEALGDLGVRSRNAENILIGYSRSKTDFIRDTAKIALLTLREK